MFETLKNYTIEQLIIIFTTPFYTVLILGEIIFSYWQKRQFYTLKDTFANLYLMLLNGGVDLFSRGITWGILAWFYQFHGLIIHPKWLYWLLLVVAEDFVYYLLHLVDHYVRLFWAVHLTHHSSEQFNLTVGFRSSVFQPLYRFIYFIPLALLGFRAADIAVVYAITQIYGIIVHTNYVPKFKKKPWKWLAYIFVTPSHHRVHHASNLIYLDKNMGMFFIIWDRIFGTFQEEIDDFPIKYGLTSPLKKTNPINLVFYEWQNIIKDLRRNVNFLTKVKYVLMPPGWSHDGSTKTAKQLREEELNSGTTS